MQPTAYEDVNQILNELHSGIAAVLGDKLVGFYLYGSLTYDGYTPGVSDIDLLAATSRDLEDRDLPALRAMHDELVERHPEWGNRVEVAYYSVNALQTYKTARSPIAIISPGEPLHFREELAGDDWLMNWYLVTEYGQRISGPDPLEIIDRATDDEFLGAIRAHARDWALWVDNLNTAQYRSYAIQTMCRTLYSDRKRSHVSKQTAAAWVAEQLPEYRQLIADSLALREMSYQDAEQSGKVSMDETRAFIARIREELGVA